LMYDVLRNESKQKKRTLKSRKLISRNGSFGPFWHIFNSLDNIYRGVQKSRGQMGLLNNIAPALN